MNSPTLSTQLRRIAEQARVKLFVFGTLAHLITVDLLREAFRLTRKNGAPGVDGVTGSLYAKDLVDNLEDLHKRLRTGTYRAQPVQRVYIPKASGGDRPIGKPSFEDKVAQRAVVMLLAEIYERDFYNFSYGFRPGTGALDAISHLREGCMTLGGGWIVDADIRGFFDNLDHAVLRKILKRRVKDGGIHRLIGKWLNAGVLEGGELLHPETGTPQGGVISPMLANIYLHTVLDEWFVEVVQPRLKGRSFMVRYADDFLIVCERKDDADRVMEVLPKRLGKYGLELHPEKTRLVQFRKPPAQTKSRKTSGNGTFDFLGFTFYWTRSRRGFWVIMKKTASKRLHRAMREIAQWCKENRHWSLLNQQIRLSQKLHGHYSYFGVKCNYRSLAVMYEHTRKAWHKWLGRRSRDSSIKWEVFSAKIEKAFPLPLPRIVHENI